MPVLPIAKSYAGATVLADIIIDKYVNHLPFYRQIEMFKQQGISIAPATINGWFQNVADLLRPTRPIALGRKNWLFCGNHDAAENAAIIYSMMACCKASEITFRDWLVYFLNNIHWYDNDYCKDLAELLPHNFKLQNQN